MLETLHTVVMVCGLSAFVALLVGIVVRVAAPRLAKQGLVFGLICFAFLHSMATKPEPTVDFAYAENGDGTITLLGVMGEVPDGKLVVPTMYDDYDVSGIGDEFAAGLGSIRSVVIPEGIASVGESAFIDNQLTEIAIPASLTEIGAAAFGQNPLVKITVDAANPRYETDASGKLLVDVFEQAVVQCLPKPGALVIPEGVAVIGSFAFEGVAPTSIAFPSTLAKLEESAFGGEGMKGVTKLDFSTTSLANVGDFAFWNCTALAEIIFPSTLSSIGEKPFLWCSALKKVTFLGEEPSVGEGFYYADKTGGKLVPATTYVQPGQGWDGTVAYGEWQGRPIAYEKGAVAYEYNEVAGGIELIGIIGEMPKGEYVVPSSYADKAVVGIGEKFLEKTSGIASLVVPEGVRYIGREAFHEIDTLSRVSLPSTLEKVGEKAFGDCYKLAAIEVADGNDDVKVVGGVLCDFNQRRAVVGVNGITALMLPAGITRIGKQAFCACTKLATADLSASELISMAKNAFAGCTSMTTVRFPTTFLLAEDAPFLMCSKLKEVYFLGAEPTVIGDFYRLEEDEDGKLVPATTFVQMGQGWEDAVAEGEWQGRPIAFVDAEAFVSTGFCTGSEGLGTVSGGGQTVKSGNVVKLTAKANKGYVFAGWYYDEDGTVEAEGQNDYRSTSFQFVAGYVDVCLHAKFIPVSQDYCDEIVAPEANEDGVPEGAIRVLSGSLPTVTVSGLPAGLTYDKTACALVYNAAKMKAGDYAFVVSAQNAGGYKTDRVVAFQTAGYEPAEDAPEEWGEAFYVGVACEGDCGFTAYSAKDSLTLGGLPAGLKLVKGTDEAGWPTYCIEGVPTKAGRYTVTWTAKHYADGAQIEVTAKKFYMTVDGTPSRYVEVSADGLPAGCKATGSGVYAAGAKVTLKATAAKGMVFAGWYSDYAFETPVACDADYRNPTLTITDSAQLADTYYPRFIELKEDFCGEIWIDGWDGDSVPEGKVMVESESLPTVTVSGLPSGMAYDKTTGRIYVDCWDKMKEGSYAVVISAKNAGGYKNDVVLSFQYDDPEDVPEDWENGYALGQIVDEWLPFDPGTYKDTLKLSGLPAGLKLATTYELDDDGNKWTYYSLQGIPTKAGRYTVTWTPTCYREEDGKFVKDDETSQPIKYYMTVQGAPSRYVEVVADGPAGCKATGSGVYAAGATVKTSATAAKGSVFANWNAECWGEEEETVTNELYNVYAEYLGKDGDPRTAAQTWMLGKEYVDILPIAPNERYVRLIARFVDSGEDELDGIVVHAEDDFTDIGEAWNVRIDDGAHTTFGDDYERIVVSVDSVSAPKLTVKGSVSGITVKNYGTWAELYYDPNGKAMPKPGEYELTFTAVNQSKATVTRTLAVRVPNQLAVVGGIDVLANLDTSVEGHFAMTVGETMLDVYAESPEQLTTDYLKTDIETLAENGITITGIAVSGLPSGVSCKDGYFSGSPTKAGVYTMTVTVTGTHWGKKVTATATAFFRVEAIDATCVGTFNGGVIDADGNEAGTISAMVSDKGKLMSCKIIGLDGKATSIALKAQSFLAGYDFYNIVGKDANGEEYSFWFYPALNEEGMEELVLGGYMYAVLPDGRKAEASQNVWSDKDYKAAGLLPNFPSTGVAVYYEEDDLSLVFKAAGAVTAVRGKKSGSARFELITYNEEDGWAGNMTVNVPDGYCRTFEVAVSPDSKDIEIWPVKEN